jgi:hypothetical protein
MKVSLQRFGLAEARAGMPLLGTGTGAFLSKPRATLQKYMVVGVRRRKRVKLPSRRLLRVRSSGLEYRWRQTGWKPIPVRQSICLPVLSSQSGGGSVLSRKRVLNR